jgi:hypothetical protein
MCRTWDLNLRGFKKINFEINDDIYEKYLTYKKLAEYDSEENPEKQNKPVLLSYTFCLFKKPLLSIHEAACIISADNPNIVERCRNAMNFEENFDEYLHAFNLIDSAVMANLLPKDDLQFYGIKNIDFKNYLISQDIAVEGFTNTVPLPNQSNFSNPLIQQLPPDIEELNTENARLKTELAQAQERIKQLEQEKKQYLDAKNAIDTKNIDLINSDLIFISVLMKNLQDAITVRANKSQSKILQKIEDENGGITGLSKSRTEKIIAEANKAYKLMINK